MPALTPHCVTVRVFSNLAAHSGSAKSRLHTNTPCLPHIKRVLYLLGPSPLLHAFSERCFFLALFQSMVSSFPSTVVDSAP